MTGRPANMLSRNAAMRVTILSRPDCHLCHVVERMARAAQADFSIEIETVNIETDPALSTRHGERIPVVLIDGIERCAGKFTEGDLRRALKSACERGSISRILSRLRETLRRG